MKMQHHPFSDGWLLVTIWGTGGRCGLEKLLSLGNFFNHATFLDEEISYGMERLEQRGFAHRDGEEFVITPAGKAFVEDGWDSSVGHIKAMFEVCKRLSALVD